MSKLVGQLSLTLDMDLHAIKVTQMMKDTDDCLMRPQLPPYFDDWPDLKHLSDHLIRLKMIQHNLNCLNSQLLDCNVYD